MPLSDCREQDVVRISTIDGMTYEGSYLTQAGMHFVSIRNPETILLNKVVGPFTDDDIVSLDTIMGRDDVLSERHQRQRGPKVPGREPVTAADYEYRLTTLAKEAAKESGRRRDQILAQFHDVADRIMLAKAKRQWLLSAGHFALRSNAPATLRDLWHADVASPSLLKRPRTQDFDPDSKVRKARTVYPHRIAADPASIPNMLARLRKNGFKAVICLAGDPVWARAQIQVDLAEGRSMRFLLDGEISRAGLASTRWSLRWGGNDSKPGLANKRKAMKLDSYKLLRRLAIRSGFECAGCDIDTSGFNGIAEYYMVHDHIWRTTGLDAVQAMLCVGCLEDRLERKLTPGDFTNAPINHPDIDKKSERLADRMGHPASPSRF